ncbi:YjfB family protein [Aquisalimonas asiatica]|uniref:Putative motility protein n=1 Tax=Aquisalimonas asiatica TaxID=406100 RepID=A0A1H8RSQ9_9GAMM|nr:YjfB family protein [Aquisalimonas asiatica]SEO68973.1 Putative motility protein [Aquisalimonas asiatica]
MADVSAIAATATSMSQTQLQAELQTSVTRKAMDVHESTALQLIDNIDAVGNAPSNPGDRVGEMLDTRA